MSEPRERPYRREWSHELRGSGARAGAPQNSIQISFELNLLAALVAGASLILVYQFYIGRRERRQPGFATQGLNALARVRRVECVMHDGRKEVLAVQTLRNSVTAGIPHPRWARGLNSEAAASCS